MSGLDWNGLKILQCLVWAGMSPMSGLGWKVDHVCSWLEWAGNLSMSGLGHNVCSGLVYCLCLVWDNILWFSGLDHRPSFVSYGLIYQRCLAQSGCLRWLLVVLKVFYLVLVISNLRFHNLLPAIFRLYCVYVCFLISTLLLYLLIAYFCELFIFLSAFNFYFI